MSCIKTMIYVGKAQWWNAKG